MTVLGRRGQRIVSPLFGLPSRIPRCIHPEVEDKQVRSLYAYQVVASGCKDMHAFPVDERGLASSSRKCAASGLLSKERREAAHGHTPASPWWVVSGPIGAFGSVLRRQAVWKRALFNGPSPLEGQRCHLRPLFALVWSREARSTEGMHALRYLCSSSPRSGKPQRGEDDRGRTFERIGPDSLHGVCGVWCVWTVTGSHRQVQAGTV